MATPSSTAQGPTTEAKKFEQITFRFCSECSNMLYPKEDEDAHKLQFTCRTCQYTESAQSSCVYRNVLNNSQGETAGVTQDVGSDPTVCHVQAHAPPVICLLCGHIIHCVKCDQPSTELLYTPIPGSDRTKVEDATTGENLGLCQFNLSFFDSDPSAEYDEELMVDTPPGLDSDTSSTVSESSEVMCADGAMIIDM